jgi:cytochrome c oxidase subunit 3
MDAVMNRAGSQRNKIHPYKFTLWIGIGSIVMMFAGLTSAYIVKSNQPGLTTFTMPRIFWYSTTVLLVSSLTIQLAQKAFKHRQMKSYRSLVSATLLLGILFVIMQVLGFSQLWNAGIRLRGSGAAQFMYIIFGLHALHVLGGVIALVVMFFKAFSARIRNYSPVSIELAGTYWHFEDLLWIYLFVFFLWIQ